MTKAPTYKEIPGFPGYRVGDDGSVWCCVASIRHTSPFGTWRRLKPAVTKGYYTVTLCPGRKTRRVHHLVLEAFVGPRPKGTQCRHFPDRNRLNNALSNLQWGTIGENAKDRTTHGNTLRGRKHPKAKLTDAIVRKIRAEYQKRKHGYPAKRGSQRWLAKKYGVHQSVICGVLSGRLWPHVV